MNSNLTTLGRVREHVERTARDHWDAKVPVDDIKFDGLQCVIINGTEHPIKPAAQRGIANRLGIPFNYLQKCDYDLQAENLNKWLMKERNEELFFRFDGSSVRAIFTPRYTPIDNIQVMNRLYEQGYDDNAKAQYSLDDEFFMLNMPDREKSFQVKKDDQLQQGISIGNSEVGMASLSISAFVLRLVCTNGLISQTSVESSYRHVSQRILTEFPNVLNQVSNDLDIQRNQWRISTESPVEDPHATIRTFNKQYNLDKDEWDAVDWGWSYEYGETMYHIVNAYTKAAQYPRLTTESEYKLQRVGGSILALMN